MENTTRIGWEGETHREDNAHKTEDMAVYADTDNTPTDATRERDDKTGYATTRWVAMIDRINLE